MCEENTCFRCTRGLWFVVHNSDDRCGNHMGRQVSTLWWSLDVCLSCSSGKANWKTRLSFNIQKPNRPAHPTWIFLFQPEPFRGWFECFILPSDSVFWLPHFLGTYLGRKTEDRDRKKFSRCRLQRRSFQKAGGWCVCLSWFILGANYTLLTHFPRATAQEGLGDQ